MRLMSYTPRRAMEAMNSAFLKLPKPVVRDLLAKKRSLFVKHGMTMFTEKGQPRVIDVQLRPWVISAAQRAFFLEKCLILRSALSRIMPLYLNNPKVRQVVPLDPEEHEWFMAANARGLQQPQAVIDRLDSTATFARPDWRENFWFLEPNSVGIGGIHYIPAARTLTADWVLPALKPLLPDLCLIPPDDVRMLLLKVFARHAKAIGRKLRRVVLIEDQSELGGTHEFPAVAEYLRRQGLSAFAVDPRDLVVRKGEVTARGKPVDILYRDSEITEMLEMVDGMGRGRPKLAGIREAFLRNQVVSSIAGEFDHKSGWELFTNPEFTRHFTLTQRRLFKAHVLWTRLLWERSTTDSNGRTVDLTTFCRRNRTRLVLKPNRAYGGEGVIFGHLVSQSVWERGLERALKKPFTHVIQQAARVYAEPFPVARPDGTVRLEPLYAVTGFAATADGLAVLGRSSFESVVNVSRKGGLIAVWQLA